MKKRIKQRVGESQMKSSKPIYDTTAPETFRLHLQNDIIQAGYDRVERSVTEPPNKPFGVGDHINTTIEKLGPTQLTVKRIAIYGTYATAIRGWCAHHRMNLFTYFLNKPYRSE